VSVRERNVLNWMNHLCFKRGGPQPNAAVAVIEVVLRNGRILRLMEGGGADAGRAACRRA
jgi:hypothetical protein